MSEENKVVLDENGDIKINDELLNKISGGSNPEDSDDEAIEINIYCPKKEK
jgi:hypothetical protein